MALNLPALPPLPAYPTGSDATPEAIVNWRELARLHTWHEELRQREDHIASQTAIAAATSEAAKSQAALAAAISAAPPDGLTAGAVAIVAELAKVLRP